MKIEWSKDLEIGVGIIDDQHKKLIERISGFVDAVEEKDIRKIEETVNYLIGYTIQHFGAEELIMIRHGYDEFHAHRDEHSRFIKMVFEVHKALLEKRVTMEQIVVLREELLDWTVNHIKVLDKKIADKIKY